MLTRCQLAREAALASALSVALVGACSGEVREDPGAGGSGGGATLASTGGSDPVGPGGAGGGWRDGVVPEGTWGPASFLETCRVEVTRGANPDVPRFGWSPCEPPATCSRWPADVGAPGAPYVFDHATRVVVDGGRTLLGTTLGNLPGAKSIVSGVWDVATGDLLIAWRTLDPACSVVAFPADGGRVWASVVETRDGVQAATHVEHQLVGGGYRVLDPEGSALASDGNARFLVETHGASTRAWDTSAASWQAIEPGVASARLHPEGMALRSLEGEVWAWSAEHGARRVARPALGTTITHLATSDDRVFWHQVRRPPADGEPPAPRGDPPPGGGGGERPDPETPSTEVRWAPHQDEADGAGGLVVTVPFEAVGGASRSRYVLVEAFHDERVHVVDLATAVTTILELPSGLRSKAVVFVGDDGGGDEVAWLAIEGLALVRMTLP